MVDIQPTTTQPISDDQELAKALAGVSEQTEANLQFEETPAPIPQPPQPVDANFTNDSNLPQPGNVTPPNLGQTDAELEPIKTEAINELRPLVDKLNLPPEEKFDTYLLLLRSTDDKTLVAPAHAAAQAITDETKKAQALLDIIKEIDYLSNPSAQNA